MGNLPETCDAAAGVRVASSALTEHAASILVAAGADETEALGVAEALVWCDSVGRANQGVWRLPILVDRLSRGLYNSPCRMDLKRTAPGVALLDADNGLGHWVATRGMDAAIELAQESGIGVVGVRKGNFLGAGSYYVERAAKLGMIGLAMSNSFPKVAALGGVTPVLGTNPFAFGAPIKGGRNLLVDMATASSSGSRVRRYAEEGKPLPEGIAVDSEGKCITDPKEVEKGSLLPFAGGKGWGLMLMVEVLAGVITGAGVGPGVKSMYKDFESGGMNGFLFLVLDIERFMPIDSYHTRMEELVGLIKSSADSVEGLSVLYPGEARWNAREKSERDGIVLDDRTASALADLARKSGIESLAQGIE